MVIVYNAEIYKIRLCIDNSNISTETGNDDNKWGSMCGIDDPNDDEPDDPVDPDDNNPGD